MNMSFGKHWGKPIAWVMIQDPTYFIWMNNKGMTNKPEFHFFQRLLATFVQKPFINARCPYCNGKNPVYGLTLYKRTFNGEFWICKKCRLYAGGAFEETLTIITNPFISTFSSNAKDIMKAMAEAKGVPKRKTKKAMADFFGYNL